jgi:N-acetylglucosamine kinase-like BadF-type ATPase
MILIADSGSSKTEWRYINSDGQIAQFRTEGLNPYFNSREKIYQVLANLSKNIPFQTLEQVYFYGAGCADKDNQAKISTIFKELASQADIFIETDLLGAARALCGRQTGIACILGTGSNSCLSENGNIKLQSPSNGVWLGDEGSGAYLGKRLIIDYLNGDLPQGITEKFEKRYTHRRNEIIDAVYRQPQPNKYLAQYSQFILHTLAHPYSYQLVFDSFTLFFQKTVARYPEYKNYKVHFTGSIAFYFSNVLRKVAENQEITLGYITETPIAGLTLYHLGE